MNTNRYLLALVESLGPTKSIDSRSNGARELIS